MLNPWMRSGRRSLRVLSPLSQFTGEREMGGTCLRSPREAVSEPRLGATQDPNLALQPVKNVEWGQAYPVRWDSSPCAQEPRVQSQEVHTWASPRLLPHLSPAAPSAAPLLLQSMLSTSGESGLDFKRFWGCRDDFHRPVKLLLTRGQHGSDLPKRLREPGGSPGDRNEVSFITIIY